MNKKSVSNIVVTLILILLILVAADILWFVVKGYIGDAKDISAEGLLIDLEIKNVVDNGETITIKVKRNPGGGEITGLKFAVNDGVETLILNNKSLNFYELEEKDFTFTYRSIVKEVIVAPYFLTEVGSEKLGDQIRKVEYSDQEAMENTDSLVSWWRMNESANDSIGDNHGISYGGVSFVKDDERGKVANFSGNGNITIPNPSENLSSDLSVLFWINTRNDGVDLIYKSHTGEFAFQKQFNFLSYHQGNSISSTTSPISVITNNNWNHVALTRTNFLTTLRVYLNGNQIGLPQNYSSLTPTNTYPVQSSNPIIIGDGDTPANSPLNGSIDEVMIFNKSLSNEEVKAIVNLKLKE